MYAAHEGGSKESTLLHTDRHLDHLFTAASDLGISVSRITEIGNIDNLLPKRVQAEKADLVLYPLAPDERYGAALQQQTVHRLLRTIKSDLAIMRVITMAKPHPRHILVPLGWVAGDKGRRLMFISELARSFHSEVTLFHLSGESNAKGMPDDIIEFGIQLKQQQVAVIERRGRGDIVKFIIVEAITRHNDLIVLGASGRGALQRLFIGNPAGDIMHQPPCNTILFRPVP